MFDEFDQALYVQDKIYELVSGINKTDGKWNFRCPICGDSKKNRRKKRGYYYPKTNSYFCFNENCSCRGLNIVSQFAHIPYTEVKKDFIKYLRTNKNKDSEYIKTHIEEPVVKENKEIEIPDYWETLSNIDYQKHIVKRKIDVAPFKPKDWKFFYNKQTKRLVLPWNVDGSLKYYQERALFKYQTPKYTFPFNKEKLLFNLNQINENLNFICFTEGCLDAVFLPQTIAVGGIFPSSKQVKEIKNRFFTIKHLVWVPDNPWLDKATKEFMIKVFKKNPRQKIFEWKKDEKYKDINDSILYHQDENYYTNLEEFKKRIITIDKMILKLKFS